MKGNVILINRIFISSQEIILEILTKIALIKEREFLSNINHVIFLSV